MNRRTFPAIPLLLIALLVLSVTCQAQWLRGRPRPVRRAQPPDSILVRFRPGKTPTGLQRVEEMAAQRAVQKMTFQREIPKLGLCLYRLSDPGQMNSTLARLRRMPEALYAEPNYRISLLSVPNDPYFNLMDDGYHVLFPPDAWPYQWNLRYVQAESAWAIWPNTFYTAATKPRDAVRAAVIDSGADITHPDFKNAGGTSTDSRFGGQLDLEHAQSIVHGSSSPDPSDDFGHGTHVSGIIGAATNNGQGIASLGYSAQIMPIKVTDPSGDGDDADVVEAMIWAADHGALVVNMSIAVNGGFSQALQDAVNYCWARNTLIIAAAGNDGTDTIRRYPAACGKVIAVAATTYFADGSEPPYETTLPPAETNASYSNYGLYISIAAPGGDATLWDNSELGLVPELFTLVWSTTPTYPVTLSGLGSDVFEQPYGYLNGTSMASPHVVGLAALYAGYKGFTQATPDAPRKIARAIQRGADNIAGRTDGGWTSAVGQGRINALATLQERLGDGRPADTPGCIVGQVSFGGVAVFGAAVTATNAATLRTYSANSKEDGTYRIANAPAGTYSVKSVYTGITRTLPSVMVEEGCDAMATDFEMGSGSGVTVTVTPHVTTVYLGGTQLFTATVMGGSSSAVTWSITSGPGTIGADGLYRAPTSGTTPATATVKASSVSDPSSYDIATVTIPPIPTALTFTPSAVLGGLTSTSKVTLSGNAPTGGTLVMLTSNKPSVASVPANATVPAGSNFTTFTVNTTAVDLATSATITAATGGKTKSGSLSVQALAPYSVKVTPNPVVGSVGAIGTLTLNGNAPAGGFAVALTSSNTTVATVDSSVTVGAGSNTATFPVTTSPVASSSTALIAASAHGVTKSTTLKVYPIAPYSVSASPNPVRGGNSTTGTVTLNANTAAGGLTVILASSNMAVATVDASVTVPEGTKTATFPITTQGVAATTSVTISAAAHGVTKTKALSVQAAIPSALTISPTPTKGGSTPFPTGTVTLNGKAPTGGLVVTLTSSKPTAATVPVSITVPGGASTATFTVTTLPVTVNTAVTITAKASGTSKTGSLTVTP